ncbi:MAG: histidinol-phosphate transaminase [Candidatus Dadabacteria bacterium]|nr:histidinol-phosphate transaminase [Candidatus Dadabacteria bacterium]NIS07951.1 histidinol-phosphate transaminase [Candidatus Dadabacteria bacterium]NIV43044.1 histidinol-phosphate transaminase [Candidatus Dadabacteria bacterium]NIX14907.1 histidinol-phosphate transaminase [Candidatus Dadabacteria bacterium]NIY21535.1 histidinol-phosphate transaminase [Candidatus Dadabacteria bacterium]
MKPNEYVRDLVPYLPGKPVEELQRELGITGAVKLASNENPIGPSPKAIAAIAGKLNDVNRYPDGDSFYLKNELSGRLQVDTQNLIIGNGSNDIIEIAARTFIKPGDEAVMGEFAFIVYPLVTKAIGASAVISPMPGLTHDLRDMYKRITPKTKMVFIANPNNPTGTMVTKEKLEWFLDKVPDDIIVLVDEAYFEYVNDNDYPDSLDYLGSRPSLITVRTFSKIYGLAGLRLGYGVASVDIISYMNRVREPFNVNSLAQTAGIAALGDQGHVESSNEVNSEGRKYLEAEFKKLGIKYYESYTNFILIDLLKDPMPIYNELLKQGVIVRPVGGYGLKTHLRVSIGLMNENKRFMTALSKIISK